MRQLNPLTLETRLIDCLKPHPKNPRKHSNAQIRQVASSIREFGWTIPILIDDDCMILAGHARVEAAKLIGQKEVPVLRATRLTEAKKQAYLIADNKLTENASWDDTALRLVLEDILLLDPEFELELTGFDTGELDIILNDPTGDPSEPETVPEPDLSEAAVNHECDLWLIGPHRLLCGDSHSSASWQALMGDDKAQMIFTDPPYNVPIAGHVSGLGQARHREFAMASGEMSPDAFATFLRHVFKLQVQYSTSGSIHYVCMDWRHMGEILAAAEGVYTELKNLCVWGKTNAGMGSFYRSQHELVFVFKSGTAPHINNFGLGETGRHRSNLWTYAGANTFRKGRMEDLAAHPTVKPIQMVADAIMDCSKRGGLVVDGFAGSGTTLLAAHRSGRVGAGIEIDPHYADLILRRLQEETGEPAIHADTFESFDTIRSLRAQEEGDV